MKKLSNNRHTVGILKLCGPMYREIALLANQVHFCQDARPDQLRGRWLVVEADQIVFVGSFERGIRPIQPVDQCLNGPPRVEDSRPWIAAGVMRGSQRFFRNARLGGSREGEVAHPVALHSLRRASGIGSCIGARRARTFSRIYSVLVS